MNSTKKLSEREVQELIIRIAKKLETLKGKYPHFKEFKLKDAIGKSYISYRHNIQWKPNPNYEKEMKELEKGVPYAKAHEPQKEIAVYPEKDGISVNIDFHSDEEPPSARVILAELRIGNYTIEFEVTGAKTKEIEEIREFVLKTLEEEKKAFESPSSSQPKTIQLKDLKVEFKELNLSGVPLFDVTNTSKDILAFYDHSEYEYGSFFIKERKIYHDELIQMQGELKFYDFFMPQQRITRSFPMASSGKVAIEYAKINELDLKNVFIFESQTREALEEAHPKPLPYRNPKNLEELEKVKKGIVWTPSLLQEEFESPVPAPEKVLSSEEKEYPMVDPRFFDLIKGDKKIEIWIIPTEGCISQFFHYGEDLRKTEPMNDQRYHGFATHKISLPPHEGHYFLECIKKGGYELKIESDVIVQNEIRVYRGSKPLTKEEINQRIQAMEQEVQMIQTFRTEDPEALKIESQLLEEKKGLENILYEVLYRDQQEKLLQEIEKIIREKHFVFEEIETKKIEGEIKQSCEKTVNEAKNKISKGQNKQKVFDQAIRDLRMLIIRDKITWGEKIVNDFIQRLEKEFKLKSTEGSEQEVYDLTEANNRFTFDLYNKLKGEEGNLFFSPFSILSALAMTYEGAKGKTAEEIQRVFYFSKDISLLRTSFLTLYTELNQKDAQYKLHTANALWVQKGAELLKSYQKLIQEFYGGESREVNFGASAKTAKMINEWIEGKTNHKIINFFSPEAFSPLTRLVLTNAIYFKGMWVKPFDKEKTKEEEFQVSQDKKSKVPMMRLEDRELRFAYAETENLQILEMPYKGDELSMFILLPRNMDLKALEEGLTLDDLKVWRGLTKYESVFIYLPKFTFKRKYGLNGALSNLGMPTAFTLKADFSGMFGKPDICITAVLHEAFVDVNEEGTEAAAVTGLEMDAAELLEEPRLFIFRADHPFLFFIQQKKTGNILFMGRVTDPKAENPDD